MPDAPITPGVFIAEAPAGPRTITGVPTSVALCVAVAAEGPVGQAVYVRSAAEAARAFGAASAGNPLSDALQRYFENGGREACALRVEGDAALEPDAPTFLAALDGLLAPDGALATCEGFTLLVVPGLVDVPTIARLQALCAQRRAFLILDAPQGAGPDMALAYAQALSANPDARHSALYYPRLLVANPDAPAVPRVVPASPAVAGVYARVDDADGVYKAPAGVDAVLRGVQGVDRAIDDVQQGPLNLAGVNALRMFPQYGPLVWGARTLATTSVDWRYVPVRRTVLFIESSLAAGLAWTVFERNDEALWAAVRQATDAFLYGLWRQGAFAGNRPEEACVVQCGRGITMTDDDVAAGRLRLTVMVALTHPAEFIVLTLELETAGP